MKVTIWLFLLNPRKYQTGTWSNSVSYDKHVFDLICADWNYVLNLHMGQGIQEWTK